MNVLVTGATGFIGRALCRRLAASQATVIAAVRDPERAAALLPPGTVTIRWNLDSPDDLPWDEMGDLDVCYHLAWKGTGRSERMDPGVQTGNACAALKLIRALGEHGCGRFVFAGSQAEYGVTLQKMEAGECGDGVITEDTVCDPVSEYGKAKLSVLENGAPLAESYAMTYIHARIFSIYGPGDHGQALIPSCMSAFAGRRHISLTSCRQKWNFLYIDDAADMLGALGTCAFTVSEETGYGDRVVDIASSRSRILREYVEEIMDLYPGCSADFDRTETPAEGTPWLDTRAERITALTGLREMTDFRDRIREIAQKG